MQLQEENFETDGAGLRLTEENSPKNAENQENNRKNIKRRFTPKRLALMAVFVALSYVVSLWSFSIFPTTPVFFLELDFGNVFILLISLLLGPVEGVIVCFLKEALRIPVGSTGGVGELANMLMTSSYILLPSIVYRYKKGIKTVIWTLVGACLIGTASALLINRFITFPLFLKESGVTVFEKSFFLIAAFNLIKTFSIGILTFLLYKRLSIFLKKMKI